jgi:hypothetical protein
MMSSGVLPYLLAGLIALLPAAGFAQEAAPGAAGAAEPAADDGEAEGEGAAGPAAEEEDPRVKAQAEEARRLRIERQTEITSSLPTEGALISAFGVPASLVGERGLRVGQFLVTPAVGVGAAYTDNAGGDDVDRDEEVSLNAAGAVRAQALLARHSFGVDAIGTTSHSFQQENDDYFDWELGGDTRLDLTRRSALSGRVSYSQDTEADSSAEAEGEPNDVQTINSNAGYQFSGNRFGYLAEFGLNRSNFSGDGSADRDQTDYRVGQRLSHSTTNKLTLFVSPQYAYSTFDEDVAADGEGRDTQTVTGLVGADWAHSSALALSAAAGYTRLFIEDSGRDDTDSLTGSAALDWRFDPRTNVTLSASHALSLTTVDDAAARTDTAVELAVGRTLGPETAGQLKLSTVYTDFKDLARDDLQMSAGLGLAHRLREHFFLTLAYQYQQRLSDDAGAEFYENQALVGLTVVY